MSSYHNHRFHVLDGMRGIAALMVMLYHYYNEFFYRCLKNGFLAVDFFFILSGFVILHAYGDKILSGLTKWEYLARRLGRLYPMIAVGLIIGFPEFYLVQNSESGNYSKGDMFFATVSNIALLPCFLGNQTFSEEGASIIWVFPLDGPLWSIFFEMIASIAFLALVRLSDKNLKRFCLVWFSLLVIAAGYYGAAGHQRLLNMSVGWDKDSFLGGFPRLFYGFSVGMLIYKFRFQSAPTRFKGLVRRVNPWLLYCVLCGMLMFPSYIQGIYDIFAVAVFAPVLVWLGSISLTNSGITRRISEFLGWISFPVYCLHVPILRSAKLINDKWDFSTHLGISTQITAIATTLLLAIVIGAMIDRLGVQRRLTHLLLGR